MASRRLTSDQRPLFVEPRPKPLGGVAQVVDLVEQRHVALLVEVAQPGGGEARLDDVLELREAARLGVEDAREGRPDDLRARHRHGARQAGAAEARRALFRRQLAELGRAVDRVLVPGQAAAGGERQRQPRHRAQRHGELGEEVEAPVGVVVVALAVERQVGQRRQHVEVDRRIAEEARRAQPVLDLRQLALGDDALGVGGGGRRQERLLLVEQDVQRVRPPVAGDEAVALQGADGVAVEVALEVAEELEVREVVVRQDAAQAPRQVLGDVVPVDLPAPLIDPLLLVGVGVAHRVADRDAARPLARPVAQLVAEPEVALAVGVGVEGGVPARPQHLVVGEAELRALALRVADLRDEQPRGALRLRRPHDVGRVEDRHLLDPHRGVLDARVALDLHPCPAEAEAPRRVVAGAGGEDAVLHRVDVVGQPSPPSRRGSSSPAARRRWPRRRCRSWCPG